MERRKGRCWLVLPPSLPPYLEGGQHHSLLLGVGKFEVQPLRLLFFRSCFSDQLLHKKEGREGEGEEGRGGRDGQSDDTAKHFHSLVLPFRSPSLPYSFFPHLQVHQISDGLSIEFEQSRQPLFVAFIHLFRVEGGREGGREKGKEGRRDGGRKMRNGVRRYVRKVEHAGQMAKSGNWRGTWTEGERERGREEGRKDGREGGREGGKKERQGNVPCG